MVTRIAVRRLAAQTQGTRARARCSNLIVNAGGIQIRARTRENHSRDCGALVVLAAVLAALSRLGDQPAPQDVAVWVVMAALYTVLTPIAVAAVIIGWQTLSEGA